MSITRTVKTGIVSDILEAAVPEWPTLRDKATSLRTEVQRRQADRPTILQAHSAVSDALLAADGPAQMQSVLDAARLELNRRDNEQHDLAVLASAMDRAEHQLTALEQDSDTTEAVCEEIRSRVNAIASKVYGLRHRPLSAQEAIDLDAATEWKALQQLTAEWQQLTTAYTTLTRHTVSGPEVTTLAAAAFTGDPLHVHPYLIGRRKAAAKPNAIPQQGSFHEGMLRWAANAPSTPFSTDEPRGGCVPPGAEPIQWLVYLADRQALTVYDPHDAIALWSAAEAATDDISAHTAESRALARAQYAQKIGDTELDTIADLEPILTATKKRRPAAFIR